jgi:hypothetical protein
MNPDRTPLVYSTAKARTAAASLLGGRCLENAVEREISAGNVTAGQRGGIVFDNDGKEWVAIVKRTTGRLRPERKAWLVTEVRRY